jgi:hypothetical protein
MGQPVKLSDSLIRDARLSAESAERSLAGQIEFWAGLGRAIEPLLGLDRVIALRKQGMAKPLSECLNLIGSAAGTGELKKVLASLPFPHYEAAPGRPGYVVRIEQDGSRRVGRFAGRRFVPA